MKMKRVVQAILGLGTSLYLYAFHSALGLLEEKIRENDNDEQMNKKACNRGGKAVVGFI
jgi:hypothetical protein